MTEERRVGAPVAGSCAGFDIVSTIRLSTLRTAAGGPRLSVTVVPSSELPTTRGVVRRWVSRPGNPFEAELIAAGSGYAYATSDAGWFLVDPPSNSLALVSDDPEPSIDLRREVRLLGVPLALCAMALDTLSLHAAAVDIGGRGVLIAGPSRAGKTTMAAAMAAAGHRVLSEDATLCRTQPASLFPGPALVRLRADAANEIHIPGTSVAGYDSERTYLLVDEDRRGDGRAVPLHTICFLRVSAAHTDLRSVAHVQAVRDLFALAFKLPDVGWHARAFALVADLISDVEVIDIRRPLDFPQLVHAVRVLESHVGR